MTALSIRLGCVYILWSWPSHSNAGCLSRHIWPAAAPPTFVSPAIIIMIIGIKIIIMIYAGASVYTVVGDLGGLKRTRSLLYGCCVLWEKRWTHTGYSLCVAGGPRQPLGLLQDDDGSRNVIRRALYLVRRQSQELRSGVREFQRQIRAAGMVSVGTTSHHTSHKIGHRRFHPREHCPA